jgi:hypothetical protein
LTTDDGHDGSAGRSPARVHAVVTADHDWILGGATTAVPEASRIARERHRQYPRSALARGKVLKSDSIVYRDSWGDPTAAPV